MVVAVKHTNQFVKPKGRNDMDMHVCVCVCVSLLLSSFFLTCIILFCFFSTCLFTRPPSCLCTSISLRSLCFCAEFGQKTADCFSVCFPVSGSEHIRLSLPAL